MGTLKTCWGCGEPIQTGHYHDGACRDANTAKRNRERQATKRKQGAALNEGVELGRGNKDLATRLAPLVIMSHADVGRILGISAEASRLIEIRALAKIRRLLLPFRNATCGAHKVKITTCPIPSL